MRRVLIAALGGVAALAATPASASLTYVGPGDNGGQGFGNVPRALTIQRTGNSTSPTNTESGCVGFVGGAAVVGKAGCAGTDASFGGNGVIATGGDEPEPTTIDGAKYDAPTIASLQWASAADIGILFNVTDPGGNGANLTDLTLKFFNSTGGFVGSIDIDNTGNFPSSETGNGNAGFLFGVDLAQTPTVNGFLALSTYATLEATIIGVSGGPETFSFVNRNAPLGVPEPATWAMMLLGFGGIGMAMRRKQRRNGALMQVA